MLCSHCGTPANPGDRVCRVCDAPLAQESSAQDQAAQPNGGAPPSAAVSASSVAQLGPAASSPYIYPYPNYAYPVLPPIAYTAGGGSASEGSGQPTPSARPGASGPATPPWPSWPTGGPGAQAPNQPAYYYPYYPYHPYHPYHPYYYYPAPRPRRAPGETYRLVISWIAIVGSGLSILVGLLAALGIALVAGRGGDPGLAVLNLLVAVVLAGIAGGGAGLYYSITAVMHRPSVRFGLPPSGIFLALTAVAMAAGVVLWHLVQTPGLTLAVVMLTSLGGLLPALTILAFTASMLGLPSTWRHVTLSLVSGATLAILLALILEAGLQLVIALTLGVNVSLNNVNTSDPKQILGLLLLLAVVAPLVEEGVKPLGAILAMPRVRGPAEAFLLGLAAGIGFDFFETSGYIGMGEADWITIVIQRIGAGLLHGVGAGMGALGWYYLMRGKGVPLRWLRGTGALLYAVLQHAIFNGSNVFIQLIPDPVGSILRYPLFLDRLPLDPGTGVFFVFYALILGVLVLVTLRLRRAGPAPAPPGQGSVAPAGGATADRTPQPVQGGVG